VAILASEFHDGGAILNGLDPHFEIIHDGLLSSPGGEPRRIPTGVENEACSMDRRAASGSLQSLVSLAPPCTDSAINPANVGHA